MSNVDDFLRGNGATMLIAIDEELTYSDESGQMQNVYMVIINRNGKQFDFFFAQTVEKTIRGEEPTAYDVLSSLTSDDDNHTGTMKRRKQRGIRRVFGDVLVGLYMTVHGNMLMMPTQEDLVRPVLVVISDGKPHKIADICDAVATQLHINSQRREEVYPTEDEKKEQNVFDHRIRWARQMLVVAGLAYAPRHGYLQITNEGSKLLARRHPITIKTLRKYQQFRAWEKKNATNRKPANDKS